MSDGVFPVISMDAEDHVIFNSFDRLNGDLHSPEGQTFMLRLAAYAATHGELPFVTRMLFQFSGMTMPRVPLCEFLKAVVIRGWVGTLFRALDVFCVGKTTLKTFDMDMLMMEALRRGNKLVIRCLFNKAFDSSVWNLSMLAKSWLGPRNREAENFLLWLARMHPFSVETVGEEDMVGTTTFGDVATWRDHYDLPSATMTVKSLPIETAREPPATASRPTFLPLPSSAAEEPPASQDDVKAPETSEKVQSGAWPSELRDLATSASPNPTEEKPAESPPNKTPSDRKKRPFSSQKSAASKIYRMEHKKRHLDMMLYPTKH